MGMFSQPGATSRPQSLRRGRQPDEAISSIGPDCFAEGAAPHNDGTLSPAAAALADRLLDAGCVRFGQFTLKSGLISPIYLDLRQLISDPTLLAAAGNAYVELLRGLKFDRLAALPYAALPIATAISLAGGWPMIYPRKEIKAYGTGAEIEGGFAPGERVVVIDDLATTGGSKFEAIEKLAAAGLKIESVVVLVDRQSGAAEALAAAGYRLHAVMTLTQMLDHWTRTGRVPAEQIAATRAFLKR
jgi:uridine monophosphate synthetase